MRILKHWANIGRAALLLCCLCAVATAVAWKYRPSLVHEIDRTISWNYTKPWRDWQRLVSRDHERTIQGLEPLAEELRAYNKHDRLFTTRRNVLRVLTRALIAAGELERARAWTEDWIEADDRDLNAQIQLVELLLREADTRDEGRRIAAELHARLPGVSMITRTHVRALLEQGRHAQALRAAFDFLASGAGPADAMEAVDDRWSLFWDTGLGFRTSDRERFDDAVKEGSLALSKQLKAGVRRVRLDPPSRSFQVLRRPLLSFSDGEDKQSGSLFGFEPELEHVERRGSVLEADGDPQARIVIEIPERLRGRALGLQLRARVDCHPAWLTALTALPEGLAFEQTLRSEGDERGIELLSTLRAHALAKSVLELSWRPAGEPFTLERTLRQPLSGARIEQPTYFHFALPIGASASELRVGLPPVVGASVTLHGVEIETADGTRLADLGQASLSDAQREGDALRILAPGATLVLPLPEDGQPIHSVRVRGVAR